MNFLKSLCGCGEPRSGPSLIERWSYMLYGSESDALGNIAVVDKGSTFYGNLVKNWRYVKYGTVQVICIGLMAGGSYLIYVQRDNWTDLGSDGFEGFDSDFWEELGGLLMTGIGLTGELASCFCCWLNRPSRERVYSPLSIEE